MRTKTLLLEGKAVSGFSFNLIVMAKTITENCISHLLKSYHAAPAKRLMTNREPKITSLRSDRKLLGSKRKD